MKGDSREGPEEGTDACLCSGTNTAALPGERAGKGETESRETLKAVATIPEREEEAGLRDKGDTPESVQGY